MFRRGGFSYGRVVVFGACGAVGRVITLLLRCSPTVTDLRLVDCDPYDGAKGVAEDLSHIDYCTYHFPYVKRSDSSCNNSDGNEPLGTSSNICKEKDEKGMPSLKGETLPTGSSRNLEWQFHQKKVTGYGLSDVEAALAGADAVVCAAGRGRTKDMKSFDKLFERNADVAIEVATAVGKYAPPGVFFAVTTSPLNCIIPVTAEALKAVGAYSPKRLFGMTAVHTARARCYYHRETGRTPGKGLMVIGGQSGQTVVPLFSQAHGVSVGCCDDTTLEDHEQEGQACPLSPDLVELLTVRVNEGGGMITKYGQPSSFACAHSCREWVESVIPIIKGKAEETVLTAMVESSLFPSCTYFSSPVIVGREGVKEIPPLPPLAPYEEELLDRCLPDLETNIRRGFTYYKNKMDEQKK